jgi:transcription initiation factor TFIIIB Brf1 subunit/transcription initiation factor TFIIB
MISEPNYKEPCPRCGYKEPAGFYLIKGWVTLVCKRCAKVWEAQIKDIEAEQPYFDHDKVHGIKESK